MGAGATRDEASRCTAIPLTPHISPVGAGSARDEARPDARIPPDRQCPPGTIEVNGDTYACNVTNPPTSTASTMEWKNT